jgi:hypothetical protein
VPGDADRPPNTFRGKFAIFVTLIHNRPTLPHLIGSARERDLLHNPFYDLLVQPFQRALLHPPLSATRIYDANVHSRWAMMAVHGGLRGVTVTVYLTPNQKIFGRPVGRGATPFDPPQKRG